MDVAESSRGIGAIRHLETEHRTRGAWLRIALHLETGGAGSSAGERAARGVNVSTTSGARDRRLGFEKAGTRILPGQFLKVGVTPGRMRAVLEPRGGRPDRLRRDGRRCPAARTDRAAKTG
ncbi:hypothetical protein C357_12951 [Citreicella sp. 357]|nr:hypothetical protein C357_12951 [Citreicella sp. 357]